ncbi:hypothetical protein [Actinoplanes couchii]|uniref:Leucine rich repeat variant n=1 Tax=Actinoplanes couchii TaxID=403638 RepID=A0ABQ3XQL2_9ACTN|nr:hypothetical protein [Actinoplanes couchii]MDR6317467.1 hypothetical protein [Actinoplanes couchii]GID60768.1 hypothetical protein Aco03nite_091720 [Actinoplanes couchii]
MVEVLRGLAENPAVPVGVLREMLRKWPLPVALGISERAELPRDLQEEMAEHELLRLLAASQAWGDELQRLTTDPDQGVAAVAAGRIAERERVMQPADLPPQHCHATWDVVQRPLSPALAEQIAASGDLEIIRSVAWNKTLPAHLVAALSRHPDTEVRGGIAAGADLTVEQIAALVADAAPEVRAAAATRPDLTPEQIATLAADPVEEVRTRIAEHAYLSENERAALAYKADFDPAEWARSGNPRKRRRAAEHPELPAELVAVLAADSDVRVWTEVARHQPGASGELLLRCFLDGMYREKLLTRPQFPAHGLARFADHSDWWVRRLVARDPDADPATINRLTRDPEIVVRREMARCPRLSAGRLRELLDDPELAADAAANPSLDWQAAWEKATKGQP